MKRLTLVLVLALGILLPASLRAAGHTDDAAAGAPDVSGMIFGHIMDSYDWHFTTIGDTHVSLYLPVIVRSARDGRWHVFSSRRLLHPEGGHAAEAAHAGGGGHAAAAPAHTAVPEYEGFHIARGGDYDGKVVETVGGQLVRPLDLSLTKNALALLLNSALLIALFLYCARWYKRKRPDSPAPRGLVGAVEAMVQWIYYDVIVANIPAHVQRYAPYLLTAFFFIFINNLIGLVPGSANVTGNIAVTCFLAVCTFLMVNLFGNKEYWKEILNPDVPAWLKPIMIVIELFGLFTKPLALMIRLFANIMAGHTAMLALFSVIFVTAGMGAALNGTMTVVSLLFCVFMNCLELLVAFIQAYVFTMLSAVFIGLSQPQHHAAHAHAD